MDDVKKPNELVEKLLNEDPGDENLDPVYLQRRDAARAEGSWKDDPAEAGRANRHERELSGADDDAEDDMDDDEDSDGSWSEEDFQGHLADAIANEMMNADVRTYADVGMMTSNKGLVVRTPQGEFQVTIVRRR